MKYLIECGMRDLLCSAGHVLLIVGFIQCQAPSSYFSGELKGVQRDSVYLFRWDAGRWQRVRAVPLRGGKFAFSGGLPAPGFYLWGISAQEGDMIFLSPKETPYIQADISQLFQSYQVQQAPEAASFLRFRRAASALVERLQQNSEDTLARRQLDSLISAAKASKQEALLLYVPFYETPPLREEGLNWEKLEKLFWEGIPLQDARVGGLPELFGRFHYFWRVGIAVLGEDTLMARWDRWTRLQQAAPSIRKNALMALFSAAQQSGRQDLLLSVAERFVKAFPDDERKQELEALLEAEGALRKGQPAPDIALPDPEGSTRRLSSLKGKWVLIDFWASWCRPCRMENPNVVRLYQKYHPKGFEIFGVSLDYQREAWIQAIRQDKLTWIHVSDLKGWQSAAARLYRVDGIPFTILVDPEGRIAAKGLRGAALEAKLREIYGE